MAWDDDDVDERGNVRGLIATSDDDEEPTPKRETGKGKAILSRYVPCVVLQLAIHVSLEAMLWDRPLSLQTKSIMIRSTSSLLSCVTYSFRAGLGS